MQIAKLELSNFYGGTEGVLPTTLADFGLVLFHFEIYFARVIKVTFRNALQNNGEKHYLQLLKKIPT